MDLTRLWKNNSHEGLLRIARDIEIQGSWRGYLSVYEHELFKFAIDQGGDVWSKFLEGQLEELKVETVSNQSTNRAVSATPQPDNANNLPEPTPQPSVMNFDPTVISFRVRYMLYDKSIGVMFPSTTGSQEIDFSILEDQQPQQQKEKENQSKKSREDDDYDDDEDDYDNDETTTNDQEMTTTTNNTTNKIEIKTVTSTAEDENKKTKEATLNFNRMYHIFDGDRESAAKQRKLEESDRQVDNDMMAVEKSSGGNQSQQKQQQQNQQSSNASGAKASLGAANLSLKHLLAAIEEKRDELQLTDLELRNLISEVRKNRSKWYNEQKIGQEELYEACEKVVMDLRGYTEHSTAFLTKVNKRDAPNYFNIIKKPMDLNTVMKKLKALSYNTKQEFVDDLNLIWDNCLTYNTDPKHFLRAHAIAMRKRMNGLIPLIPDITIRDRSEVEAEEREANGMADSEDENTRTSRKGKGTGKGPAAKKGRKRKIEETNEDEEQQQDQKQEQKPEVESTEMSQPPASVPPPSAPAEPSDSAVPTTTGTPVALSRHSSVLAQSQQQLAGTPRGATPGSVMEYETSDNEPEDLDVESEVWHNVYSKQRAKYCCTRGDLFKDNKLQMDQQAPMRRMIKMSKFEDAIKNIKPEDEMQQPARGAFSRSGGLLESLELEKKQFILEYEVASGLPEIPWHLDSENPDDGMSNIEPGDIKPSDYVGRDGLTPIFDGNLREMQEIRKICSKIAVVRQMQNQTYMHSASVKPYNVEEIKEQDLDLESRLPNRDKYNGEASQAALRRSVSKMAMHTGYESTEMMAIDALTEIAADYMGKLAKTLMSLVETNVPGERYSWENLLTMMLQQNGIEDVNALDWYVNNDVGKLGPKLQDLRKKLESFLGDLLRPAVTELDDNQFQDNSDVFLNGDFSEEIGEDFFGFRELGLDKEFGLLTSSVPFHLLHSRLSAALHNNQTYQENRVRESTAAEKYKPMDHPYMQYQLQVLQPLYLSKLAANKNPNGDWLLEDEALPPKQRNTRPKVPPTGKIASVKKKPLSKVFFKPARPSEKAVDEAAPAPKEKSPSPSAEAAAADDLEQNLQLELDDLF